MRQSAPRLLSLFLAALLLAGQWAGQLHALSHAKHDLIAALGAGHSAGHAEAGAGQKLPPLDHPASHCVVFHALDSAAADTSLAQIAVASGCAFCVQHKAVLRPAEPIPFFCRAPPVSLA